jgi:hypothetical protein
MPYSTAWDSCGVTWTYWGEVTGEELLQSNREIYDDARFPTMRYQIVDLTRVERFAVRPNDMIALAESDHVAARTNPSIRVAVAAADESIRILSLYYEGESSDSPWEQQVFDTLAEAQKWARGDC